MADSAQPTQPQQPSASGPAIWRLYRYQKVMFRVVLAAVPPIVGSVYFFGWRSLSVILVSVVVASLAEWLFCRARGEPVSSAVFVTAVLLALTMPPRVPYMVVVVAAVVAIVFGKEVFGGYARNVFNPALVGRCFVYVCFPVAMTGQWLPAFRGWPGGFARWVGSVDAFTRATPLAQYKAGEGAASLASLFRGDVGGCLGETSAVLILIGAAYLLATRAANWRIPLSCVVGGVAMSLLFRALGSTTVPGPLYTLLSGGFLFGAVYMATDPISASQTNEGRFVYGFGVGAVTVIIRGYSSFAGGVMFAILLMNMFAPLMDHYIRELKKLRRAAAAS